MSQVTRFAIVLTGCLTLLACASSPFVSTWKAPDATPLELRGSKVAAVVMMENQASRRAAEDALAREITARGAGPIRAPSLPSINRGGEGLSSAARRP